MKIRSIFALTILVFASAPAVADDVGTYVWEDGCNHTMTTTHFMLAPGAEVTVDIDLSKCDDAQMDSLLFFAYVTGKKRSRQLTSKDRVRLSMYGVDAVGKAVTETATSSNGSLLVDVATVRADGCVMTVKNNNRKELKLRLRSQLVAPYEP